MKIRLFYIPFLGLFALFGLDLAVQAAKPVTIPLETGDLDFEQMDPRCRSFLKTWRLGWKHAVRDGWLYGHADEEELIYQVLHEARFYFSRLQRRLGGSIQEEPVHLLVFSSDQRWKNFLRRSLLLPHSQAVSTGNAVFLLWSDKRQDLSKIAHELVHMALNRRFKELPLWLDEGLALQWGEELTHDFYSLQNRYVAAHKGEELSEGVDFDVTTLKEYPESYDEQRFFYRRSKAMVDRLQGLLGDEAFLRFLDIIAAEDSDWRKLLKKDFNISDEQLDMIEAKSMPKEKP